LRTHLIARRVGYRNWEVVRAENTLELAIAGRAAAVARAESRIF
jgi:hypothetical protein